MFDPRSVSVCATDLSFLTKRVMQRIVYTSNWTPDGRLALPTGRRWLRLRWHPGQWTGRTGPGSPWPCVGPQAAHPSGRSSPPVSSGLPCLSYRSDSVPQTNAGK